MLFEETVVPAPTPNLAIQAMREGLERQTDNKPIEIKRGEVAEKPRFWPSTLLPVDRGMGGLYGFSSITGFPGLGKSMLAIGSALSAAAGGWQVVHFFAENDLDDIGERVNLFIDTHPETEAGCTNYHPIAVGFGQDQYTICGTTCMTIDWMLDAPVLVVVDSANSVVNMNSRAKYLEGLKNLGMWMMAARKLSKGAVSFLVTNEANKSGAAKGEGIPFWADVDLRMGRVDGSKKLVRFSMEKTRRTEGLEMGVMARDWARGEFLVQEELEQRAVPKKKRKSAKVVDITALRAGHEA